MWYQEVQLSNNNNNNKKAWKVRLIPKKEINNEVTFVFVTKSSHMNATNFSSSISFTVFLQPPGSLSENHLISFSSQESLFYYNFF